MPIGWIDIARTAQNWAAEHGVDLRDAVMLVPFAQHLAPARRAWAQQGGWQPRIETTRTLIESMGPVPSAGPGQLTFDGATDRLIAARLLRTQSWVSKERLAFDDAVAQVVAAAHAFSRAASALAPDARPAHWQAARDLLSRTGGPGATERALARVALEWAASGQVPASDVLFGHRPSAWLAVQAGGADALTQRVLESAADAMPCVVFDTDASARQVIATHVTLAACDGFEGEAEAAAAQVLAHLQAGVVPVALVAQDRMLMRRVRALLERQQVGLVDETGWKLSTTRAAAQVMSLLRAAHAQASMDLLFDWLKAGAWPEAAKACSELESVSRRHGWSKPAQIDPEQLSPGATRLSRDALLLQQRLAGESRRPLSGWLSALRDALQHGEMWAALTDDDAGLQTLQALRLSEGSLGLAQEAAHTSMSLDDFSRWVDGVLEEASFVPSPPTDAPSVIITPLQRVMLRPFAAIVFPGACDRHLGASPAPHRLLSEAQAEMLGLPTLARKRSEEALAFDHAICRGPVNLFYRHSDGPEPLMMSPLVARLLLRLQAAGRTAGAWVDPRGVAEVLPAPIGMPAPHAAELLPARLSASACEALRACPYRFHALYLLRLREADELDDTIEKRDYGTWLHDVLTVFHERRRAPQPQGVECDALMAIANERRQAMGLDDADFLPFHASFVDLAPRYIEWLHGRDAQHIEWWQGEQEREHRPDEWGGVALHGRIDRMDRLPDGTVELIDYKTGSATALRAQVKQPLEDTQLAFYAALMQPELTGPVQAGYLALARKIEFLPHPDVEDSARELVRGVGHDLARIRAQAPLPALGQSPVCDFCEARGLCRRDHWSLP